MTLPAIFYEKLRELTVTEGKNWASTVADDDPRILELQQYVGPVLIDGRKYKTQKIPVAAYRNGEMVKVWPSMRAAAADLGININTLRSNITGRAQSRTGLEFRHISKQEYLEMQEVERGKQE